MAPNANIVSLHALTAPQHQLAALAHLDTILMVYNALFVTINALNAQILPPIARLALTDTTWMDPPVQTALLDA